MSDPAIELSNVSKRFVLRHDRAVTLKERFVRGLSSRRGQRPGAEDFWAVRDVSLRVMPGETLGIVGANGSGKSTLLRLMAGIYRPTRGHVRTHGRIMPLIGLGLGFHPELTGEENVYLNASIFGLSNADTRRIFPEIVAFAELEAFIDTPLKHYSSGMSARLGFAVAAHLNPDILLLDEVLAVGDASFVKKCNRKIYEFKECGKTIVLVTHRFGAVLELCERAFLFHQGQLIAKGTPNEILEHIER